VKGDKKRVWAIMKQELKNAKKCDFDPFLAAFRSFPNPMALTVQIIYRDSEKVQKYPVNPQKRPDIDHTTASAKNLRITSAPHADPMFLEIQCNRQLY
jgi:hypothetical protein